MLKHRMVTAGLAITALGAGLGLTACGGKSIPTQHVTGKMTVECQTKTQNPQCWLGSKIDHATNVPFLLYYIVLNHKVDVPTTKTLYNDAKVGDSFGGSLTHPQFTDSKGNEFSDHGETHVSTGDTGGSTDHGSFGGGEK